MGWGGLEKGQGQCGGGAERATCVICVHVSRSRHNLLGKSKSNLLGVKLEFYLESPCAFL